MLFDKEEDSFEDEHADIDFIGRAPNIGEDDGLKDDSILDGFSEENCILADETDLNLRNSVMKDLGHINLIKTQLETQFGKVTYNNIARIVKGKTQATLFSYDQNMLMRLIHEQLAAKVEAEVMNNIYSKIPEFYCIVYSEMILQK